MDCWSGNLHVVGRGGGTKLRNATVIEKLRTPFSRWNLVLWDTTTDDSGHGVLSAPACLKSEYQSLHEQSTRTATITVPSEVGTRIRLGDSIATKFPEQQRKPMLQLFLPNWLGHFWHTFGDNLIPLAVNRVLLNLPSDQPLAPVAVNRTIGLVRFVTKRIVDSATQMGIDLRHALLKEKSIVEEVPKGDAARLGDWVVPPEAHSDTGPLKVWNHENICVGEEGLVVGQWQHYCKGPSRIEPHVWAEPVDYQVVQHEMFIPHGGRWLVPEMMEAFRRMQRGFVGGAVGEAVEGVPGAGGGSTSAVFNVLWIERSDKRRFDDNKLFDAVKSSSSTEKATRRALSSALATNGDRSPPLPQEEPHTTRLRVRRTSFSQLSWAQTTTLLKQTDILMGVSGAGFTNQLWLKRGSILILIDCTRCFVAARDFCTLDAPHRPHELFAQYAGHHMLHYMMESEEDYVKVGFPQPDGTHFWASVGRFLAEVERFVGARRKVGRALGGRGEGPKRLVESSVRERSLSEQGTPRRMSSYEKTLPYYERNRVGQRIAGAPPSRLVGESLNCDTNHRTKKMRCRIFGQAEFWATPDHPDGYLSPERGEWDTFVGEAGSSAVAVEAVQEFGGGS